MVTIKIYEIDNRLGENMNYEDRFLSIWNSIRELKIPEPPDDTICMYALRFQEWVNRLLKVLENPDAVSINQAKILLTDKFFDWRRIVPQSHRHRLGLHGHTCVFQVFETAYEKLRFVELGITPPMVFIPKQPPPSRPPINLNGIVLAEELDNDE